MGDTSQFEGSSELLKGAEKFEATLKEITLQGQTYSQVEIDYPGGGQ